MSWKPGKCISCDTATWITETNGNLVRPDPYKMREAYIECENESGFHYIKVPLCNTCENVSRDAETLQVWINKLNSVNAIMMPEMTEETNLIRLIKYKDLWANRGIKAKPIWETLLTTSRST